MIGRRYGVDPAVIVAIWGLETNYGGFTGGFSVIEALATLAADGRRDGYFRTELIDALRILDAGDIALPRMTGSYAGAMGQPQFMPSSYLNYAVSFDGSRRRDIWDNRNDALASIANYLPAPAGAPASRGANSVRVPAGFTVGRDSRDDRRPLAAWTQLGVTRPDGTAFATGRARRRGDAGRARRRGVHGLRQFRRDPALQPFRLLRALGWRAGRSAGPVADRRRGCPARHSCNEPAPRQRFVVA